MGITIIQDTREPESYTFGRLKNIDEIQRIKLDFADYTTESLKNLVVIERKTKSDLFSTLGSGRKRFMRELDRSVEAGVKYFYLVVESNCSDVYDGNLVITKKGPRMTRPFGNNIISQLISFIQKHELNIIPIFASDASTTKKIIRDILNKSEEYLERGIL